jgi:hypothetical protein
MPGNAICERLIGTLRRELPDRTLILNQAHLRAVLTEYQEYYNTARPRQGIHQRIPDSGPAPRLTTAAPCTCQMRRKPVLSGLINEIRASCLTSEIAQVTCQNPIFERHSRRTSCRLVMIHTNKALL